MKKIVLILVALVGVTSLVHATQEDYDHYTAAVTAGYVFKSKQRFHEVYGQGIANLITVDGCYSACQKWGIGVNAAYWRGQGATNFLGQHTLLQQVPFVVYVRRDIKHFNFGLDIYGSLGGGFIWTKEKSYLGKTYMTKGIGAVELGATYPVWCCIAITGAFRYLFPPQTQAGHTVDIGGCDLRFGIEVSF